MNKKAFTLIELLAVIVILAIISLIAVPIVINIINDAKKSSDEESIKMYAKAVETAAGNYFLKHPNEKSVTIEQLEELINYNGKRIECETTRIYSNGKIYLKDCTIGGEKIDYTYGKEQKELPAYSIGDQISYNNIEFRVLSDSPRSNTSVTLIKDTPLKKEEINQYGQGRINNYGYWTKGTADYDSYYNHPDGYGGMAYYSTEECGYINNTAVTTNCTLDFNLSDVGNVAKNWAAAKLNMEDLVEDSLGYKVRLITVEELINNFGYDKMVSVGGVTRPENPTDWISFGYFYWTMSKRNDSNYGLYFIDSSGRLNSDNVYNGLLYVHPGVRPVITIKKVSLQK